jgi:putative peptidoglycan lipid II flippase
VEGALAWRFGISGTVDAYRVTVLLLLYGQQLFVTSILPFVLVPVFAQCRAEGREHDAWIMADSVGNILLAFGTIIAASLFFRPELAVGVMAPGLSGSVRATATFFIRWCGIAFIPICWTGAACGVLYAYNIVRPTAISQLTMNVILGLSIALGGSRFGSGALLFGMLSGAFASTLIYTIQLAAVRRQYGPNRQLLRVDFRLLLKALKIAMPLIGSAASGLSTSVVVNRALSRLPVGSLAAFGYASKMGLLVQLMPNALAIVIFPRLSAAWYSGDRGEFAKQFAPVLRAALYIALPLTAICWMLRRPLVSLFFQRGAFTVADVQRASVLFSLLVLSGPAASVSVSLGRAFYAMGAPRFPVMMDITGNALELFFVPFLTSSFGAQGAAFAYSLLPWITGGGLLIIFKSQFPGFSLRDLGLFVLKTILISAPSAWLGERIGSTCANLFQITTLASAFEAGLSAAFALTLYYGLTAVLKFPEARSWINFVQKAVQLFRAQRRQATLTP